MLSHPDGAGMIRFEISDRKHGSCGGGVNYMSLSVFCALFLSDCLLSRLQFNCIWDGLRESCIFVEEQRTVYYFASACV